MAASSEQLQITSSTDTLPKSIVLGDRGGTVVVQLRDKQANPVAGIEVIMPADPSGLSSNSRGSWTHVRSFHQVGARSSLGNVRYSGVPVGKILVRAKFDQGVAEQSATVVSGQELSLRPPAPSSLGVRTGHIGYNFAPDRPVRCSGRFCILVRMPVRGLLACLACLALFVSTRADELRPVVSLQTSMGIVRIELYPQVAPKTVANFLAYVNSGFYDDTVFHRVIEGFVVQGGGFTPELTPKPTRKPVRIETKAGLSNERGAVAMARQMGKDTATSQFFINLKPNTMLDRAALRFGYTVFGRVIEGMEVVDRISRVQTSRRGPMQDVPILPVFLEAARVER